MPTILIIYECFSRFSSKKCQTFAVSSFLHLTVWCFSLSFITVLGFGGLVEQKEDVTPDSFLHFID